MAVLPGNVRVKPHPIILNLNLESAVLSLRGHEPLLRARMSDAVAQRFTDDEEDGLDLLRRQAVGQPGVHGQMQVRPLRDRHVLDERSEGDVECLSTGGMEAGNIVADLLHHMLEPLQGLVNVPDYTSRIARARPPTGLPLPPP